MTKDAATEFWNEIGPAWIFKHVQAPTIRGLEKQRRRDGGHEFIEYTVDWRDVNDNNRLYVEIHMKDGDETWVIWNKQVFENEEEFSQ